MSEIAEKVVVITGASSGIGEATARLLAEKGARLMVGARRTDRLQKLVEEIRAAGGTAEFQAVDVTRRAEVEALVASAEKAYGRVDVLVNNAGLMPLSNLDRLLVDEWNQMIDVNIKGVLHGIAAVLPRMQARKSGHIINLSSIGGHTVVPTAAVYCATKFAVGAISEGLRQEVGRDIRVTVISPGVTESELAHTITDPEAQKGMEEFRSQAIPAEAIARSIAYAIEQPAEVSVSEIIVRPTGGF